MPIPRNATATATASDPGVTYADFVPPYPFDFDFEPDSMLPPPYASLDIGEPEPPGKWQPTIDGSQPLLRADEQQQQAEAYPCDIACAVAVAVQLLGILGLFYGGMSGYSPIGLQ